MGTKVLSKEKRNGLMGGMNLQLFGMSNPDNKKDTRSLIKEAIEKNDNESMVNLFENEFANIKRNIENKHILEECNSMDSVEVRMFKDVILPKEKFKIKDNERSNKKIDLGKLVRGMAGAGWNNAEEEHAYNRSMNTGSNKVLLPTETASQIIDIARSKSAILGSVPVIPMKTNKMTVITQKKDAVAHFVDEDELIPSSEAVFEGVDLEGKTLAIFVPISMKLLETAENLTVQLETSVSKAIGQALDKAMMYGKGKVEGLPTEIKGISEYTTINKVSNEKADYDLILKGTKAVKKANYIPTNICYNTDLATDIETQKDSTGQYIQAPNSMSNYIISESNNIENNNALIYDSNCLLMGLNQDINIEWGTTGDMFQRLQVGLRIHMRVDLVVVNPEGIALAEVKA